MEAQKTVTLVEKAMRSIERNIDKLKAVEAKARAAWTRKFHEYEDAVNTVMMIAEELGSRADERRPAPKKVKSKLAAARKIVASWVEISATLTKKRNEERAKIQAETDRLQALRIEMAELLAKVEAEKAAMDEVVDTTFDLNRKVVEASESRAAFLTRHVYPHLIDDDGNLRTQITFMNSDQTRKVVALVNSITKMEPELAARARQLIDEFFNRFSEKSDMDEATQALFSLTRNILVEKTEFKVGPDLYRFLGLEIKEELFPELFQSQLLLRKSMRSEKTDKYVRLYERESPDHSWEQVSLS